MGKELCNEVKKKKEKINPASKAKHQNPLISSVPEHRTCVIEKSYGKEVKVWRVKLSKRGCGITLQQMQWIRVGAGHTRPGTDSLHCD